MDYEVWFRDPSRMDWKSMFVYDPSSRVVRLIGSKEHRAEYATIMFRRKYNYRNWLDHARKESGHVRG